MHLIPFFKSQTIEGSNCAGGIQTVWFVLMSERNFDYSGLGMTSG